MNPIKVDKAGNPTQTKSKLHSEKEIPSRLDALELHFDYDKYHPIIKKKIKEAKKVHFCRKPKIEQFYYLYLMILNRRAPTNSIKDTFGYYLRQYLINPCTKGGVKV